MSLFLPGERYDIVRHWQGLSRGTRFGDRGLEVQGLGFRLFRGFRLGLGFRGLGV